MKLKFKVEKSGVGYLAAIDPSTSEHRKATSIGVGQEVELDIAEILSVDQIVFGDVVDSPEDEAAEPDGGTAEDEGQGEAPPADEGTAGAADAAEGNGGTTTGDGEDGGETPTTSAASEKPLYLVEGEGEYPEGFTPSGLETPDGKTLFHFANDTAGQSATGNVDGVSVYADADDNEKPVQAEAANTGTGQETASA